MEEQDLTVLREAAEDIAARFSLTKLQTGWDEHAQRAYETLHTLLRQEIARMLAKTPEKLMQILYRIDVSETKVSAAFAAIPGIDLAGTLADLIIERQLQKMKLRQHTQFLP